MSDYMFAVVESETGLRVASAPGFESACLVAEWRTARTLRGHHVTNVTEREG
jgi:hypothetical protein